MKANAKAAKGRASQMQAHADVSAERLEVQRKRAELVQRQHKAVTSTIKPYS